ncbi:MAG: GNAT family N-acetyltransferase [candidate division WOR-3 bacterium]|nr:GNAT family N-acetyltransferase [candidate division WOR-3 bacterium]
MIDWKKRIIKPEEAVKAIKSGHRVFIGSACGSPQSLVKAITSAPAEDVEITQILNLGIVDYASEALTGKFRTNTFFIGRDLRERVWQGGADYTPIFLSEIPRLFRSGRLPIDVALITVSLPDEHGYCSFGISVDITKPAAESAKIVIAEINPNMPRTLGDSFIHINDIDYLVYSEQPLLEFTVKAQPEIVRKIAKNVSDLIEDGSTIQVGYGGVPTALLDFLQDKKDIGIHTEVFSDNIIDLIEKGVITNQKKTLHKGKAIASFAMGTKRLYQYLDNNPFFEFHPVDYTNDPFIIAQNDKMVAINSAIEIDLTGQVCADSIGYLFYSGIGGQLDFVRGAARSKDGKPIIVVPSVRSDETKSRIVPHLSEGAGVVTTRGDVHYVVTEWGIANLYGKTIRERALSLISIAHPKFRAELLKKAKELKYVYQDQPELPLVQARYPEELETWAETKDGHKIFIRPIKPTDEPLLRELFYTFSQQTIYYRFFSYINAMPHDRLAKFVNVDYENEMAIVAVLKQAGEEKIIGVARYALDKASGLAEFAFVVADNWQNKKVGTALFSTLIKIARMKGIKGFIGYVLDTNIGAYRLTHKMGYPIKTSWEDGVYKLVMMFSE